MQETEQPSKRLIASWSVLAVAFGLTTVLLVTDLIVSYRDTRSTIDSRLTSSTANGVAILENALLNSDSALRQAILITQAAHSFPPQSEFAAQNKDLADIESRYAPIQPGSMRVMATDGQVVTLSSPNNEPIKQNLSDKPYLQPVLSGTKQSLVAEPLISSLTGHWLLPISRAILGEDGKTIGVAQLMLSFDRFADQYLYREGVLAPWSMAILTKDAEVLLDATKELKETYSWAQHFGQPSGRFSSEGREVFFRHVDGSNLIVASSVLHTQAFASWYQRVFGFTLAWTFVGFMMGALWVVTRQAKHDKLLTQQEKDAHERTRDAFAVFYHIANDSRSTLLLQAHEAKKLCGPNEAIQSQLQAIETIIDQTAKLLTLTNGQLAVKCAAFQPQLALQSCVSQYEAMARTKGLDFFWDQGHHQQLRVQVDHQLVQDIVCVLLHNAVRFTFSGRITVHTDITVPEEQTNEVLQIRISSTSRPMDTKRRASVKKTLAQSVVSTQNTAELHRGLTVASLSAKAMGGFLTLKDDADCISFTATIPSA